MRKYIVFLLIPFLFACKKQKEKKFTGTFEGTMIRTVESPEVVDGYPVGTIVKVDSSTTTMTVIREGDFLKIKNAPYVSGKIDLNDIGRKTQSIGFINKVGNKFIKYSISEKSLRYRYIYSEPQWYFSSTYTFSGIKIEE